MKVTKKMNSTWWSGATLLDGDDVAIINNRDLKIQLLKAASALLVLFYLFLGLVIVIEQEMTLTILFAFCVGTSGVVFTLYLVSSKRYFYSRVLLYVCLLINFVLSANIIGVGLELELFFFFIFVQIFYFSDSIGEVIPCSLVAVLAFLFCVFTYGSVNSLAEFFIFSLFSLAAFLFSAVLLHRMKSESSEYEAVVRRQKMRLVLQEDELITQRSALAFKIDSLREQSDLLEDVRHERDALINIIGRDLRRPINSMRGLVSILETQSITRDEMATIAEQIRTVSENSLHLINTILEATSIQNTRVGIDLSAFSLRECIKHSVLDAVMAQAQSKNITIHNNVDPGIVIYSDQNAIKRILENLISNAIRFSGRDKNIWIDCLDTSSRTGFIIVKDEGPGITLEDQTKMFRKFRTLTAKPTSGESSTGLGLAIVKFLADKLDLSLSVKSEPEKGTEFGIQVTLVKM